MTDFSQAATAIARARKGTDMIVLRGFASDDSWRLAAAVLRDDEIKGSALVYHHDRNYMPDIEDWLEEWDYVWSGRSIALVTSDAEFAERALMDQAHLIKVLIVVPATSNDITRAVLLTRAALKKRKFHAGNVIIALLLEDNLANFSELLLTAHVTSPGGEAVHVRNRLQKSWDWVVARVLEARTTGDTDALVVKGGVGDTEAILSILARNRETAGVIGFTSKESRSFLSPLPRSAWPNQPPITTDPIALENCLGLMNGDDYKTNIVVVSPVTPQDIAVASRAVRTQDRNSWDTPLFVIVVVNETCCSGHYNAYADMVQAIYIRTSFEDAPPIQN